MSDIDVSLSDRAYTATLDLLSRTSKAPSLAEIAKTLESFAIRFGSQVGYRLCVRPDSDGAMLAVRNAVDRAARGEP